jgi:hypothetical protein
MTLAWLKSVGWAVKHGPHMSPDGLFAERADYREVVLTQRLRDALARLDPELLQEALEDACRRLTCPKGANHEAPNRAFHWMLVGGSLGPAEVFQDRVRPAPLLSIAFSWTGARSSTAGVTVASSGLARRILTSPRTTTSAHCRAYRAGLSTA